MDHPCRSIWVLMTVGSMTGGIFRNSSASSTENPKRCTEEGDLYVVRSMTESRALLSASAIKADLRNWPCGFRLHVPQIRQLVHVFQQTRIVMSLVPNQPGSRACDGSVQVPYPNSYKDGFCSEHYQRLIDRVELMNSDASRVQDGPPFGLGFL
jgi:hypothetical protein